MHGGEGLSALPAFRVLRMKFFLLVTTVRTFAALRHLPVAIERGRSTALDDLIVYDQVFGRLAAEGTDPRTMLHDDMQLVPRVRELDGLFLWIEVDPRIGAGQADVSGARTFDQRRTNRRWQALPAVS